MTSPKAVGAYQVAASLTIHGAFSPIPSNMERKRPVTSVNPSKNTDVFPPTSTHTHSSGVSFRGAERGVAALEGSIASGAVDSVMSGSIVLRGFVRNPRRAPA